MTEVSQAKPDVNVDDLTGSELILLHAELHSLWKEIDDLGRDLPDWDKQSLARVHTDVREALDERGLPHQSLNGLDDEKVVHEMMVQFEPVEQSFEQVGDNFVNEEDWE